MAIDDNTVYGLTGAQVKELPGKIEAVKGLAKVLTTADYNWPTSNPTQIALWLLEPGIYTWPSDMSNTVRLSKTKQADVGVAIVTNRVAGYTAVLGIPANFGYLEFVMVTSDGTANRYWEIMPPQNNLTSTSSTAPLAANQGKALKDLIDAIVVPTKTSDLTNDSNFVTSTEMDTALADKADTNDIPTALSELTNDINAVSDANYVHTDNNYTTTEKTKLAGIAAGAEANVQSNWAETNTSADSYIQNKPTIPTAVSQLTNDAGYTTNTGTITGVSANGTSVATSGVANIPSATTSRYGVTQLSTSTSSTSTTLAATPSAVRTAYNLADSKATITMTATDPGEGATLAENNYVAVYGGDPVILDYSTSEVNTGTTWIDGAPIYKKTINFGALPNATHKTVAHGISSLAQVVKIEAIAQSTTTGRFIMVPLVYNGNDTPYNTEISVTDTNIEASSVMDRSSLTTYVTLYYTKSS